MIRLNYQPPSLEGLDLSDPDALADAFASRDIALQSVLREIERMANDPKYITMENGKALDAAVRESSLWRGCMLFLDTTLSEARRECRNRGFRVMDGTGGSRDCRHLFVRAAGPGEDAGGTGGSESCTPALTICDHNGHDHPYASTFCTCCGTCCIEVCCYVGGPKVAPYDHYHGAYVAGDTSPDSGEGRTHCFCIGPVSLPPYYEAILVEKVND